MAGAESWVGAHHEPDKCNLCAALPVRGVQSDKPTLYTSGDETERMELLTERVFYTQETCRRAIEEWSQALSLRFQQRAWDVMARSAVNINHLIPLLSLTSRAYYTKPTWSSSMARTCVSLMPACLGGAVPALPDRTTPTIIVQTSDRLGILDLPDYAVWVHPKWWNVLLLLQNDAIPQRVRLSVFGSDTADDDNRVHADAEFVRLDLTMYNRTLAAIVDARADLRKFHTRLEEIVRTATVPADRRKDARRRLEYLRACERVIGTESRLQLAARAERCSLAMQESRRAIADAHARTRAPATAAAAATATATATSGGPDTDAGGSPGDDDDDDDDDDGTTTTTVCTPTPVRAHSSSPTETLERAADDQQRQQQQQQPSVQLSDDIVRSCDDDSRGADRTQMSSVLERLELLEERLRESERARALAEKQAADALGERHRRGQGPLLTGLVEESSRQRRQAESRGGGDDDDVDDDDRGPSVTSAPPRRAKSAMGCGVRGTRHRAVSFHEAPEYDSFGRQSTYAVRASVRSARHLSDTLHHQQQQRGGGAKSTALYRHSDSWASTSLRSLPRVATGTLSDEEVVGVRGGEGGGSGGGPCGGDDGTGDTSSAGGGVTATAGSGAYGGSGSIGIAGYGDAATSSSRWSALRSASPVPGMSALRRFKSTGSLLRGNK